MDIQEQLTAFALLGSEWVMWLMLGLSVLVLAIILERGYYFFASRDDVPSLALALRKRLEGGDESGAKKLLGESKSFEARIALATLEGSGDGVAVAEERWHAEGALSRIAMERNLGFIGTVGSNAPFVGLLGTVIEIVAAFKALDQSGGQVSSDLMSTIGEALVATAMGLLVALPAVAAYNFFLRVIKVRLGRADALAREVIAHGKREGGPKKAASKAKRSEKDDSTKDED